MDIVKVDLCVCFRCGGSMLCVMLTLAPCTKFVLEFQWMLTICIQMFSL